MLSRKSLHYAVLTLLVVSLAAPSTWAKRWGKGHGKYKNVIVMVPDGCAPSIQTLARWVNGAPLNVDALNSAMATTYMANSVITGSAAAATAFATGHKTTGRFLGVGPRTDDLLTGVTPTAEPYVPIASVLEGAKLKGKSTGLIATSRITHATPAGYACHIHDRGMDNEIMEHMVYQNLDVVFGGGARHLIPKGESYETSFGDEWGGKRTDGENLIHVLLNRGYQFVDSKSEMNAVTSGPVWGLFDDSHMDPDLDRDDLHPTQPSLADMTEKAIELLSQNRYGFFLVVEASQVDWAGHANDAAYMVSDFLAFDEAVGKALKFAEADGNTMILMFPDHNTGALSIGHQQSDFPPSYTETTVEDLVDPIKDATMTIQGLLYQVPAPATAENVRDTFAAYLGGYWENMPDDVAQEVADILNDNGPYGGYYAIAEFLSKEMTTYGWTTHGHTGEDVPVWTYPKGTIIGTVDNTDLAQKTAEALGLNLKWITKKLFVNVSDVFPDYSIDASDPENEVLVIKDTRLPVSKDELHKGGKTFYLDGIVVGAPMIESYFIPADAVKCITWDWCR